MATTQAEQIRELNASLAKLDAQVAVLSALLGAVQKDMDRCVSRIDDLMVKVAALEERSRTFEKLSDRGWNFGQAIVVSIASIIGGALLSFLIQLATKR